MSTFYQAEREIVASPEEKGYEAMILNHTCLVLIPSCFTVVRAVSFKQDFQKVCQENSDLTEAAFDFSQTTFMDSSGLGALVGCWKIAKQHSVRLVLKNLSQQVMAVLTMADLDKLFEIEKPAPAAKPQPVVEVDPRSAASRTIVPVPPLLNRPAPAAFITHRSIQSRTKRTIDIVGSLVGLTITAVLFVPIVVAIKLDSPGPVFFGQVRCSRMSRRFKMWKFRSMVIDAEQKKHLVQNEASGAIFKAANDPRITRVGRFLRKTSLDELPQFWNVLKGEMSLVGTRPPTPDEVERYEILQWQRLDIKPGMTGEWQVNGRSSVKNFEDIVRLDLKYQENWSLSYDLQLIFKTFWVVFNKNSGAM